MRLKLRFLWLLPHLLVFVVMAVRIREVLDYDAINCNRTKLNCQIFGCSHKLARRARPFIAALMQPSPRNDPFL